MYLVRFNADTVARIFLSSKFKGSADGLFGPLVQVYPVVNRLIYVVRACSSVG
jgi:hypothetical protein